MGWARLDDGYAMHPKLVQAGLDATGLDARAISHCAKYETDGFVADAEVSMLAGDARKGAALAKRLAAVNRWERDDDRKGYWVHDYLDYNKSHEQLEAERKSDRSRKNSGRNPGGKPPESRRSPPGHNPESKPTPNGIPPDASHAHAVGAGAPTHARPPSRPVPSVVDKSSSSNTVDGVESEEEEDSSKVTTAARLVAERRLAARTGPPVTNASSWLRTVRAEVLRDHGDELRELASRGLAPKLMADRIMPLASKPYGDADDPLPPAWDESIENGRFVAVPRRTG